MYLQAVVSRVHKKGELLMRDSIYKIREISDSINGVDTVNTLLSKGWTFISACQVGTPEAMDIIYVVGATKEVFEATSHKESTLTKILTDTIK